MGVVAHGTLNLLKHAFDIPKHVVVPEAQNAITVRLQRSRSFGICNSARSMLTTVDLDNEMRSVTCEVHDVLLDPNLPTEMRTADRETMTEMPPEFALGVSGGRTHLARKPALRRCGD